MQRAWLDALAYEGQAVAVAHGFDAAVRAVLDYLDGRHEQPPAVPSGAR